ncbi:MAG: iron-containing alcohol dehydrogenase [Verrucomicrobiota bacterium]|nr:iron-containing alcohol dehydrogenase [Verrucomicrobiota bacterium]
MLTKFNFYRTPKIEFGCGNIRKLPENIASFGKKTLIITGGKSFRSTPAFFCLIDELQNLKIKHYLHSASGEPSPGLVNSITDKYRNKRIKVVVGIGGGSVMDTAKAVSAMLLKNDNVENYLEGVGNKYHDGRKIPFIAVPTTSGTGSEATKNAVLSQVGESGYKKSLRHDNFIPNLALIDPELMISCPHSVSINCALDAFSQLIESFVSKEASPFTDSLVISAVKKIKKSFFAVIKNLENVEARSDMAYVALISGITLANAGLGTVH